MQLDERKQLKLLLSVSLVVFSIALLYHFRTESEINRFSGVYVASLELIQAGYVEGRFFTGIPLFDGSPVISADISVNAQDAIRLTWEKIGLASFHLMLIEITGMSSLQVVKLPIGVLLLPIVVHMVARRFLGKAGILFSLFIVLGILSGSAQFYVSALSLPLYFLILNSLFGLVHNENPKRNILVVSISLLTLTTIWHTATVRAFLLVAATGTLAYLGGVLTTNRVRSKQTHLVMTILISGVLAVPFLRIWDHGYVYSLLQVSESTPFRSFINNLITNFTGGGESLPEYVYDYRQKRLGQVYFYFSLLLNVLGASFLTLAGLFLSYKILIRRSIGQYYRVAAFVYGIGLAQIAFSILYSQTALGLHYVTNGFILFGGYALIRSDRATLSTVAKAMLILCVLIAPIMGIATIETDSHGENPETSFADGKAMSSWVSEYNSEQVVMVDFATYSKYMYHETRMGNPDTSLERLHPEMYELWTGQQFSEDRRGDLFAVDRQTMEAGKPVHSYLDRAQYGPNLEAIDGNMNASKTYSDGRYDVYIVG